MANIFTNAGKAIAAKRMIGTTPAQAPPIYVGWGTGAGTAAAADTTLFTEAAESRVSCTQSTVTTTQTNDTIQNVGTLTSASGQTITNAGIFDASSSGNLFQKSDFTGVALLTGDGIQFTFKVAFS